jgi:phenylacetate-CoA ligase
VKTIAGGAYSLIPKALRHGRSHAHYRAVAGMQGTDAISCYAHDQLGQTLQWAVNSIPFYRGLVSPTDCVIDPIGSLRQFPFVSKAEIKHGISQYLSDGRPISARLKAFTGGSTAEPMAFFLEKGVSRPREDAFMENFHSRLGVGAHDVVLALRGRTVPNPGKPGALLWMFEPIKRQLILSSDHLEANYMPQYLDALRKWQPAFIQAFPSAIFPLAKWLSVHPEPDITSRIKGIMLYSENVYQYQVELLKQVFNCPVLKHYGHSERVLMAASMPDDDRCFFWPQYGHFELVNEQGQIITTPGVLGEIVGTSFDNRVMPFIRYRTGDLAILSDRPSHTSLQGYPVVERIEGRLQEFLVTRDHRLISICTMGAAHFGVLAQMDSIQYEQSEPGIFDLKVVAGRILDTTERGSIERAIVEKTQGSCEVRIREVAQIQRTARGKHVMLIQHLNIQNYLGASETNGA